jgi:transglutaminase-like putative cysteine protease
MPILYSLVTSVLALTGCFSLVMTGEVNLLMSLSGIALIPGYYRLLKNRPPAPGWAVGMLSVLTLVVFVFESAVTGDVFLAVAHLTIAFQAIKSYDLKEPWDHLQVYFMSLLQLIIASELTHSLLFGAVFILFMVLFVTAMVLSHFLKEDYRARPDLKKPVFLISVLTLVSTLIFFVAVPRTPFRFMGRGHERGEIKTTGFSDRVDFGSFGDVKRDPTVVMRIEMKGKLQVPYYWRGLTLDYFDGTTWRKSITAGRGVPETDKGFVVSSYSNGPEVDQKVFLEPVDSNVIFGLSRVRSIQGDSFRVRTDEADDIFFSRKSSRGVEYTVYSAVTRSYPGTFSRIYLQLPAGMERVAALARQISSRAKTDQEKARSIEDYLKRNYRYSLSTSKPPRGMSPIADFIFRSKEGYCEHYATSMVVMLRSMGIPSRIVNGFHGGEINEYGGYVIVRQSDAHSWVEALINGMWTRFDPTPSVPGVPPPKLSLLLDSLRMTWARYVVGFSFADQRRIVRTVAAPFTVTAAGSLRPLKFGPALYLVPLLAVLGFVVYFMAGRLRLKRHDFITGRFIAFRRMLSKKGFAITSATTTGEIRREARRLNARGEVERFLEIYERHRFGAKAMSPADRKEYLSLLREIRKS